MTGGAPNQQGQFLGGTDRVELIATIIMALAAIFTAWAAFQSAKWSGEQATSFSRAGAARTESTRFDTRAGQEAGIDVAVFMGWLNAFNADVNAGLIDFDRSEVYEPADGTLSGFLFARVRPEFRPALDSWVELFAEDPATAPPTPFAMDEYVLASAIEADRLQENADSFASAAGVANQNSDDYVLTAVAFALVLFFGGVSSKLGSTMNRYLAVGLATLLFIGATCVLIILPKILPF